MWHSCRNLFSREVSGQFGERKMLPELFYGALLPLAFHAKPVLITSKLVIALAWILEVLIQLRKRHAAVFTRLGELSTSAIFLRPCSIEICEWVES